MAKWLPNTLYENGGDLRWSMRGRYGNISFEGFKLKDGEVHGPIQAPEGYALIKRLGYHAIRPMKI
ncbi:MAG: hypothetical protein GXO75_00925 [Calditrichaeota bacterium]|nr:hypothetical protein [Calditrichota bacterium]